MQYKKGNNALSMQEKSLKKITQFLSDNQQKNSSEKYKKLLQNPSESIT